ncbi:MAG: glycosyltransferase family 2 protein [Hyphococcus sp.]
MHPLISVIIVNYNSGARLQKCLDALAAQHFRDFEIIVADNNSSDGSLAVAPPEGLPFETLALDDNIGFAAANNRAAKRAKGEWLAFLNPDAYAEPDWLTAFVAALERYRGVDAFGSFQIKADDPSLIDGAGDAYFAAGISYRAGHNQPVETAPPEGECFAPCAAAAFYRQQTFDALGGFAEHFFCYSEDVDLAFRLRLAGGRAVQLRDAVVRHEGSGIASQISGFAVYHGHRNRLWTYFRNMPLPLLALTLPAQTAISLVLAPIFFSRGYGADYMRAVWDGLSALPRLVSERRRIQTSRKASAAAIGSSMVWSPIVFLQKSAPARRSNQLPG